MKAARCAPTLCGGKPDNLAADTASHRLNFLAARLNGTESPPKRLAIRRMSGKMSVGSKIMNDLSGEMPRGEMIESASAMSVGEMPLSEALEEAGRSGTI